VDQRHSTVIGNVYNHIFRSRSRCSSRSRRRHRSLLLLLRACAHADTTTTICLSLSLSSTADVARFCPSLPSRTSDGFKTPFTKKKSTSLLRLRARFTRGELGRWPSLVFFPCSFVLSQNERGVHTKRQRRHTRTRHAVCRIFNKSFIFVSAFFFFFFWKNSPPPPAKLPALAFDVLRFKKAKKRKNLVFLRERISRGQEPPRGTKKRRKLWFFASGIIFTHHQF
jgi:hypothetical protein